MALPEPEPGPRPEPAPHPAAAARSPVRGLPRARRRTRLARGPLSLGEPAPPIEVRLAAPDPYRPDTIADGGSAFGLTIRAASVRGLWKRHTGGPRQDDLCLRPHEPTRTVIVAVADGVSGSPRSDLGAALAVRHAAAVASRQLDSGGLDALDWKEIFDQAGWALVEQHRRDAGDPQAGPERAGAALATTLIVALLTAGSETTAVRAAAVGDSPAFKLAGEEFAQLVGEAQQPDELLGGGVDALPNRAGGSIRTHDSELGPGDVLLVCTDGLALPLADGRNDVGRALARELTAPPDIVDFARLLDFSRATYDDDRTLVAVWPGQLP